VSECIKTSEGVCKEGKTGASKRNQEEEEEGGKEGGRWWWLVEKKERKEGRSLLYVFIR